jgi:hypothetical protein
MTTFDEREKAYEKKFSMDQEFKFKAVARRNRLLAEWAAAKLGLSGAAVNDYIREIVRADLARPGDGAYRKLKEDLEQSRVGVSDSELRNAMSELLQAAVRQIEDAATSQSR